MIEKNKIKSKCMHKLEQNYNFQMEKESFHDVLSLPSHLLYNLNNNERSKF
jgi:hypothetical protein